MVAGATAGPVRHLPVLPLRDSRVDPRQRRLGDQHHISGSFARLGGRDAYTAAKGGVLSLTRSLAVEYAKHHIRVNALAPGPTLTERVKTFVAGDQRTDEKNLLGMAEPDDVAQAALFLASDESRRITGTIVPVDSGAGCSAAVFPCPASSRVEQFTPAIDIRGHSVLNSVAP